jgi:threonyl-tRNA synthetase
MLVVGDEEEKAGKVAVRRHKEGDVGGMTASEFAGRLLEQVALRA